MTSAPLLDAAANLAYFTSGIGVGWVIARFGQYAVEQLGRILPKPGRRAKNDPGCE